MECQRESSHASPWVHPRASREKWWKKDVDGPLGLRHKGKSRTVTTPLICFEALHDPTFFEYYAGARLLMAAAAAAAAGCGGFDGGGRVPVMELLAPYRDDCVG